MSRTRYGIIDDSLGGVNVCGGEGSAGMVEARVGAVVEHGVDAASLSCDYSFMRDRESVDTGYYGLTA